jgi:dihydrofolate reductase
MRGIIAAVSPEWVIGAGGTLPWSYPKDLERFKRLTLGTTVIMGRHTWQSLPKRPLKNRRNVVITSREIAGVETYRDLSTALAAVEGDVWFIGGARIFAEAMRYADTIDLTFVPDHVDARDAVRFPPIDPKVWRAGPRHRHEDDPRLERCVYTRVTP